MEHLVLTVNSEQLILEFICLVGQMSVSQLS